MTYPQVSDFRFRVQGRVQALGLFWTQLWRLILVSVGQVVVAHDGFLHSNEDL